MWWPRLVLLMAAASVAAVGAGPATTEGASLQPPSREAAPRPPRGAGAARFTALPLLIVGNAGQNPSPDVVAYVKGRGTTIYFTPSGVTHTFVRGGCRWTVAADFVGAAKVRPELLDRQPTRLSYFKGRRADWRAGLPTFREIAYRGLWPGIDLVYRTDGPVLKYEFHVAPGADASLIQIAWRGADSVALDGSGRLTVATPLGGLTDDAPVAWQGDAAARRDVAVSFQLGPRSDATRARFRVGAHDPSLPLVIDPQIVVYAGYLGGTDSEDGGGIAVDADGNAYVTGKTFSDETEAFPLTVGPDLTFNGAVDAFAAKVKADGTALVWCGYIGGSAADVGNAIAVDAARDVYVAGSTTSAQNSFPVKVGPDLTYNGGNGDAFVAKIAADGASLVWCGYIGGSGTNAGLGDDARAIAVDGSGRVLVGGQTASAETDGFPVAVGPDTTYNGGRFDGWIARVKADGTALDWCGYVGGNDDDSVDALALDAAGTPYIGGFTRSGEATFPVKVGPDLTYNGLGDAFVAKVLADGTGLVYAGYVGGAANDGVSGVAVDVAGALCVTGDTQSAESSFPVKIGPDLTYNGNVDCFVAKVRPDGTGLVYCGYIGGANRDVGVGIGVDSQGNACVGGTTSSDETTFPVLDPFDATANGGDDLFVARVSPSGALLFSGFVGGANDEETRAATADAAGNVYLWGFTGSTQTDGFPLLTGPDLTHNGNDDCFIAKVGATTSAPADVVESFFLPKRIVATQDAKTPAKSKLIAAGFFDLGPDEPDLTKSATLDVGGFSFAIPGLTLKGKNYVYAQPGMDFTVFTNPARSSRARFRVRTTGDLTGKVDLNGPLTLKFTSGDVNGATGLVNLTAGRYAIGRIRGALVKPNLYLSLVKAVVKGGGKDSLTTVLGLATNGVTPAAASDFTLQFGATYAATIPAASFVKKGDKFVFKGSAGGVTSATLDYLRETITVNAKNVDLGTYAPGGNSVLVSVGLGAAQHAVRVRMVRTGRAMKY